MENDACTEETLKENNTIIREKTDANNKSEFLYMNNRMIASQPTNMRSLTIPLFLNQSI